MNDISRYREETIKIIKNYLNCDINEKGASDWALDIIVKTKNLEDFPTSLISAIQCLADLHDKGESWCPTRDELERWKTELEKET